MHCGFTGTHTVFVEFSTNFKQSRGQIVFFIVVYIGEKVSKFWGCEEFCPNFTKLAWKFCASFAYILSPTKIMKTTFGVPSKKVSMCFSANVGWHFLKSNKVRRHLAQIFRDFVQIFRDFVRNFKDFAQIFNESKLLGYAFTPCTGAPQAPTPLAKEVGECQQVSFLRNQSKRGLFFIVLFKAVC